MAPLLFVAIISFVLLVLLVLLILLGLPVLLSFLSFFFLLSSSLPFFILVSRAAVLSLAAVRGTGTGAGMPAPMFSVPLSVLLVFFVSGLFVESMRCIFVRFIRSVRSSRSLPFCFCVGEGLVPALYVAHRPGGRVPDSEEESDVSSESDVSLSVEDTSTSVGFNRSTFLHWKVRCPTGSPHAG